LFHVLLIIIIVIDIVIVIVIVITLFFTITWLVAAAAAVAPPLALTAFADLLVASRLFNLPQEAPEFCQLQLQKHSTNIRHFICMHIVICQQG